MKRLICVLTLIVLWPAGDLRGQLAPPDQARVAMGHLHYHVRDVEANKKFWVAMGAQPAKLGVTEALGFPGVLILLTQAGSSGGTEGSVVNHVAFRVPTLARLEAAGLKVQRTAQFPGVSSVFTPEGERIELFDDSATNLGFIVDNGRSDALAERHNRSSNAPIVFHHIHLYVPQGQDAAAKAWYVRMFGGTPGKRWRYEAADFPGVNFNFSGSPNVQAPTKGRMLDHIGFEIKNLESFCRELEARGVKLDAPYTVHQNGVATALLTDPWGTSIELTEDLNRRGRGN